MPDLVHEVTTDPAVNPSSGTGTKSVRPTQWPDMALSCGIETGDRPQGKPRSAPPQAAAWPQKGALAHLLTKTK